MKCIQPRYSTIPPDSPCRHHFGYKALPSRSGLARIVLVAIVLLLATVLLTATGWYLQEQRQQQLQQREEETRESMEGFWKELTSVYRTANAGKLIIAAPEGIRPADGEYVTARATPEAIDPEILASVEARCEILWNALPDNEYGVSDRASLLIAYEKQGEQSGGYGLFFDGRVEDLDKDDLVRLIEEANDHTYLTIEGNPSIFPLAKAIQAIISRGGRLQPLPDQRPSFLEITHPDGPPKTTADEEELELELEFDHKDKDRFLNYSIARLSDAARLSFESQLMPGATGKVVVKSDGDQVKQFDSFDSVRLSDSDLRELKPHLTQLTELAEISFLGTDISDAGLEHISELKQLRKLDLKGTRVTNTGLLHLKDFSALEALDLMATQVDDAGLAAVAGLTNLERLNLSGTKVTDDGLRQLVGIDGLEVLLLGRTQVTDRGVDHLETLKSLKYVVLWDTQVTEEGVARLKAALPDCEVIERGMGRYSTSL